MKKNLFSTLWNTLFSIVKFIGTTTHIRIQKDTRNKLETT